MANATAGWGFSTAAAQSALAQVPTDRANDSQRPDRVERAAREFESILLTQWLEQAHSAFAGVPGGDEQQEDDDGAGQLRSLGMQALAAGVSKAGGLGIARMILNQMQKHGQPNTTEPEPVAPSRYLQPSPSETILKTPQKETNILSESADM